MLNLLKIIRRKYNKYINLVMPILEKSFFMTLCGFSILNVELYDDNNNVNFL